MVSKHSSIGQQLPMVATNDNDEHPNWLVAST